MIRHTRVQPELRRLFGQPGAVLTVRFKRASVNSNEHNITAARIWGIIGEEPRTQDSVIACSCSPLFSSSYNSASLGVPVETGCTVIRERSFRDSLSCSWDSFSPLSQLWQLQQIKPTMTAHTAFTQRSSGAGGCACPNDVPATTCIRLPPAIPQFPGSMWGHFNSQFLKGTDIIANNTPRDILSTLRADGDGVKAETGEGRRGCMSEVRPLSLSASFKNSQGNLRRDHTSLTLAFMLQYTVYFLSLVLCKQIFPPSQWTGTHHRNWVNKSIMI